MLNEKMSHQTKTLEDGKKLQGAQAAWIQELEGELTAKDQILNQTLEAAKISQSDLNKAHEANKKIQFDMNGAFEVAKTAQADKEKAVREAHESAQQALKMK